MYILINTDENSAQICRSLPSSQGKNPHCLLAKCSRIHRWCSQMALSHHTLHLQTVGSISVNFAGWYNHYKTNHFACLTY